MENVKLLGTLTSPHVKRVIWALNLKGIEYEVVNEDHVNPSPELLKYNPIYKKTPVLVHSEKLVCDSLVILEYIDETWNKASPFLPQDPFGKAKDRFWAKFSDEQVLPSFYGSIKKRGEDQEEAKETTLGHLKHVEQLLNDNKFLSGANVGFLDLAFGWIADYSHPIEVVTGMKLLDEDLFPHLCAWRDRFLNIPAINQSWPDQETLIVMFQQSKERHAKQLSTTK